MDKFKRYFEAIRFLEGFYNLRESTKQYGRAKNPEIYIKRMKYFLKLLKNPDRGLKFIHITGTAGKGTVANMLHSILVTNKQKTGLFTSPFATTSIEKIKVDNFYIAPDELAQIVEKIKPAINQAYADGLGPSYFEIFFAIALLYFQKKKCQWAILEVGAGGKYDATNVIKNPKVTVITCIDYDHTELLGKTLTKIAQDKAGIVKKGSIFWTAEKRPHLLKIFKEVCKKQDVKFNQLEGDFSSYQDLNRALVENIAKEIKMPEKIIERGIKNTKPLPCRFEKIQKNPFGLAEVILDGAHNRSKMQSTVDNLKNLKYRKLFLIIGFAHNKKLDEILELIAPYIDYLFATRFQIKERKCADPNEILQVTKKFNPKIKKRILLDPNQALERALKIAKKDDLVLVTGSFYLAGELREKWYPEKFVLKKRQTF